MKKALLLALLVFLGLNSFAGKQLQPPSLSNDSLRTLVLKQLKLKLSDCKEELFAEKALPNSKTETALVIPKLVSENEEYGYVIDAIVVVVNNQTGKIVQRSEGENFLEADAVMISGFTIDTAPYMLSKDVRAFGVRVNYRNASYPNPYYKTDLILYVREGNKLRSVFGYYEVSAENGERGSDECNAQRRMLEATIAIDTESSNGFFHLIIKENVSMIISKSDGAGDCEETTTETHERKTILYYNGKTYNFGIDW